MKKLRSNYHYSVKAWDLFFWLPRLHCNKYTNESSKLNIYMKHKQISR